MATTRLPLRWQASSAMQKGNMSTAACGRLRHLQAVATWASAQVPPLGAFLGSRLASASQILGSPPPPSPHFTCQKCESILQVGINCSVRVRSKKGKKGSLVSKEAFTPINSILYYCNYCAFENMKLGTPTAYVKAKIREVSAHHKLSELNKAHGEKTTKTSNNELVSATKVISMQSAGSSGKRPKRKGWLSLKQLTVSSADLSPTASIRPVLIKSDVSTPIPRMKILDSPKVVSKISLVDVKSMTPLSIKEQYLSGVTKPNLELEPCNTSLGDICSKNISNLIASHRDSVVLEHRVPFTPDVVCHSSSPSQNRKGVAALSSHCDAECTLPNEKNGVVSESQPINAPGASLELRQNDTFDVPLDLEKKEQLSSDAEAITVGQITSSVSVSQNHKSTSAAILQMDMDIVAPTLFMQGEMVCKNAHFSSSFVNTLLNADSHVKTPDRFVLKPLQSPLKEKEGVFMSDKDVESGRWLLSQREDLIKGENKEDKSGLPRLKKRHLEERVNWHKVGKKQKLVTCSDLHCGRNLTSGRERRDIVLGREVASKKQPMFRRMGRHWFTKSRSSAFKWRII